ncbi:MAG: hypothetical protein QOI12_2280 [Alphaproteobacteria bacterium]|jgi:hypothetical protein|nr:hypothetical protein [Alphaproteobacteria bacterium]
MTRDFNVTGIAVIGVMAALVLLAISVGGRAPVLADLHKGMTMEPFPITVLVSDEQAPVRRH